MDAAPPSVLRPRALPRPELRGDPSSGRLERHAVRAQVHLDAVGDAVEADLRVRFHQPAEVFLHRHESADPAAMAGDLGVIVAADAVAAAVAAVAVAAVGAAASDGASACE